MRLFSQLSSVSHAGRLRADGGSTNDYNTAFFAGEDLPGSWVSSLSAAGVNVTPELAMTLAAYYCGVTTIAYDLATLPCQVFKTREDGGRDLVRGSAFSGAGGIGGLAYKLRWQPNAFQSATEFFVGQIAQFLLRGVAYAEIVDGPTGFLEQLLPRHPDRVHPERLPNGNVRYKLTEANGQSRYRTQDEMHIVRDVSTDRVSAISRVQYGANTIGAALAAERAASKFFKSGMTAAAIGTYKGGLMEDEEEQALHRSITRYASGVENTFGFLLVPDDVTISNLGIEPEKAQMMLAREWGAREVARHLRIPPHKLMIAGTQTYASQFQSAVDYVVGCLRPSAVLFEQDIQRDLVLAKDAYVVKFHLRELLQGDPAQMGEYIEKMIASRAMTPSEARMLFLDLNPDAKLDQLSESDNKPGQSASPSKTRAELRPLLGLMATAVTCVRRERAAVTKLAQKHASDVAGWQAALREFYGDHAGFVAHAMGLPVTIARGYCAQHGSAFEAKGVIIIDGDAGTTWEREEAVELAGLALDHGRTAA